MTDIIEVVDDTTIVAVVEQAPTIIVEVPQDDETTVVEIHVPGPQGPGSTIEIGGDNTQVQFNDGGLLAGDPTFVFDKGTKALGAQILETSEIQFPSVDGTLTVTPAAVTADVSKVMVVADSQTVGGTINFGDTGLDFQNDQYALNVTSSGVYASYTNESNVTRAQFTYYGCRADHILIDGDTRYTNYATVAAEKIELLRNTYSISTTELISRASAALRPDSLRFGRQYSSISIVVNGDMADEVDLSVQWPAESGTLARVEDITLAIDASLQPIVVGAPSSVAGVLTLDFAGKSRAVFAVTLTENVTSVVHTNVPTGVFLEKEVHYTQGGAGTYTVAQPASHKALGGSDTAVATTVGKVTVQSAASVDGGTTWRYAMQESG